MILFTLSMPNVGSWNGQWTGSGGCYAKTRKITDKQILERIFKGKQSASFYYNFGEGWGASVRASIVPADEAHKAMNKSQGFCGYDWMIDEIIAFGKIKTLAERDATNVTRTV